VAADTVIADNSSGAYEVVSHLAALGHRRIAFLSTDNVTTTSVGERLYGYRQALEAAGIPYDDQHVFCRIPVGTTGWGAPDRQKAETRRLIAAFLSDLAPTAAFAIHDRLAFDVHEAASAIGWRVPEDLSIAGFDDDPVVQGVLRGLTTARQPRERMGRLAARLLVQRVQGSNEEPVRYSLSMTFLPGHSTAPPRTAAATAAPTSG
jgi:DNA-binding LacI/PurR family transcriptional regulator